MEQETCINTGVLVVEPILVMNFTWFFAGEDVIWFVNNWTALTQLIIGATGAADAAEITLSVHRIAHSQDRTWYEYVGSKANPSYVLSRVYEQDGEVIVRITDGIWRWLDGADFSPLTAVTGTGTAKL